MSPSKHSRMDSMVGLPFVRLPGCPAAHVVMAETFEGQKIRAAEVQQVFNDALLMDAIEGDGFWYKSADALHQAILECAERHYGVTLAAAVKIWRNLPKLRRPGGIEWPGGGAN